MHTEEQAKETLCWKKQGHDSSHGNQHPFCDGSLCMAWRWAKDTRYDENSPGDDWIKDARSGEDTAHGKPVYTWVRKIYGYCGPAGASQ